MKGFMKGCGIAALILVVLGTLLFSISAITKKSDDVKEIAYGRMNGLWKFENSAFFNWAEDFFDWGDRDWSYEYDELENDMEEDFYDIENDSLFNSDFETYSGNIELTLPNNDVTELKLGLGGCIFRILESENNEFKIKGNNVKNTQAYIEDGALYLVSARKNNVWDEFKNCEIELYIPRNMYFDSVELDVGAGSAEVDMLYAGEMKLTAGAGSINAKYLEATDLDIESGAGQVKVEDMVVNELDVTVGAGRASVAGSVESVEAMCAAGSLDLIINGTQYDYDYEMECMAGNIQIDGTNYSGLASSQDVYNGTGRLMNLECSMGNIKVSFR